MTDTGPRAVCAADICVVGGRGVMLGGGGGGAEQHKATARGQGGEFGRPEHRDLLVSPSPPLFPNIIA